MQPVIHDIEIRIVCMPSDDFLDALAILRINIFESLMLEIYEVREKLFLSCLVRRKL